MDTLIETIFASPVANLLIVAGLVFLGIAVVGNIRGKIQPGKSGRIASGLLGLALLGAGLAMYSPAEPALVEATSEPRIATPAPSGFRLVEAMLRADPFDYTGPCPATITFSGRISAVGGSAQVSYKFLRNDGASAPIQTLTFDSPGSKDVSETWTLGGPSLPIYSGWVALQILEPQELTSQKASFTIRCE
jgi:hypothetical protein